MSSQSHPDPVRTATTRFSDRAQAYSRHRPGYPAQALDALFDGLVDPHRLHVADIGAGTGISTALLAERVEHVIAIEPNAQMREHAASLPNVTWRDGTGERTGLPSRAVDVATAFQAFHWFDADVAFAEFTRIARRRIGLVQYERDETCAFSAAYGSIIRRYATDDTEGLRMRALDRFSDLTGKKLRRTEVSFSQVLTLEGLIGRVASSSYLPQTGERADALRTEMRALFESFQLDGSVEIPMTVYVLIAGL